MTVTSDEQIAAWQADITQVQALVTERTKYLAAQANLAASGHVTSFTVASGTPGTQPVNLPISGPLDGESLALVSGAIDARLAEIAAALLALGIVDV